MSDKVRIYQLARDLGVENSELLAALDDMGVEYKSVSSTIDAETADTLKQLLQPGEPAAAPAAKSAKAASAPVDTKATKEAGAGPAATSAAKDAAAKDAAAKDAGAKSAAKAAKPAS
ncbi:MAG TPA: translation initiation factor IF-2 N-terminal domain-containing protein, partial [Trueperaceae bacterium]|nr:translation initiation factor IF-2 N-terminal domain-containing protein [Trueperaceae bacterium]